MAKKAKVKENEEIKQEADPIAKDGKDGDAPKHNDEEQDMALIKKMLDEYLGADQHGEHEAKMAMEAYQAYKEMGHKEDEAMKNSGVAMKLAKHMSGKKNEEKDESRDAAASADDKGDPKKEECEEKKMEAEIISLKGKLAKFEEAGKKAELESYIDTKLKDSKKPMSITKKFREAAGEIKTKEDFESKWKIFSEGYGSHGGEALDFSFTEKGSVSEDGGSSGGDVLSFTDCVN